MPSAIARAVAPVLGGRPPVVLASNPVAALYVDALEAACKR